MNSKFNEKPELVILPRPQISVVLSNDGQEVLISTSAIADDYQTVEHTELIIPRECAQEIGEMLLTIAKT